MGAATDILEEDYYRNMSIHDSFESPVNKTIDEDLRAFPVSSALAFVTILIGGVANSFLIYVTFFKSKLMTVINKLLLVQCVINLSESIVLIPIRSFLMGTAILFSARNHVCRFVLSWSYANWANFCFSLFIVASIRLLYLVAPLKMHSVRDRTVVVVSVLLLGTSQLAWFISSMLVKEKPFGSASCMTEIYEHSSVRIILSIIFNLSCVVLTLATYIGITVSFNKPSIGNIKNRQRNIITVKIGLIQSVFLLLTFLMPLATRMISYRGFISPSDLAQWNMLWINFCQCSVYPLLTIVSSSTLRKESVEITKPCARRFHFHNSYSSRRIDPLQTIFSVSDSFQRYTYPNGLRSNQQETSEIVPSQTNERHSSMIVETRVSIEATTSGFSEKKSELWSQ